MKFSPILVLVIVSTTLFVTPALADTTGEPNLSAHVSDNRFAPGESAELLVTVQNRGEIDQSDDPSLDAKVTTARGVEISIDEEDAPIDVRTTERALGSIGDGESTSAPFRIVVDDDAEPGEYEIEIDLEYEYIERIDQRTNASDRYDYDTESESVDVTIVIEDGARFEVESFDSDSIVGSTGTVTATVTNVGTEPASDATFTVNSNNSAVTFDGAGSTSAFVEEWGVDETRTFTFGTDIAADADQRNYPLTGIVEYEGEDGQVAQSRTLRFGLIPESGERFTIDGVESDLMVGDTGTVTANITNLGGEIASDATVTFTSVSESVSFDGGDSAATFVGEWAANETRTFTFEAEIADVGHRLTYPILGTVEFERENGKVAQSRELRFGVTPAGEQTFSIDRVESDLRVGDSGTIRGELVNTGETTARNVVATLESQSETVDVLEPSYAVGDLAPGERATVEFDADVSDSARDGPRQFSLEPEFRTAAGDRRMADPVDVIATVGGKRDEFTVHPVNATFSPGESGELVVSITNIRDEPLSDISAKLFVESPVSVSDDEAYIDSLPPNETRELRFAIGVAGSAMDKAYPVEVDFRYEDADGDDRISDTYTVPVTVSSDGNGGFPSPLAIGTVVLAIIAAGGYLYWRP